jgi:molybdopterin/thiamine biosynthesis adenylyltransferase
MAHLKIIDHTKDRYHALAISSVWELTRIRTARALVVGIGALGNEVCKNLAMMGVRLIAALDRDTVEVANLSRSVFFRQQDEGQLKTEVIRRRIEELNPDVEVLTLPGDLSQELGLGLIRRMDMIFSCLDSRLARRTVNRMCGKVGKPWVDGAMENLLGEVSVYMPENGRCYECGLTEMQKVMIAEAASCRGVALRNLAMGKVPTTSTMGSIVAALQVQEGVKLLHEDYENALVGKTMAINCNINDFYITGSDRKADEDCDGHQRFGKITEVKEFTASKTSARTILQRFKEDAGEQGILSLGREVVTELYCGACGKAEVLGVPLRIIDEEREKCPACGGRRELKTTHEVRGHEPYSEWPLNRVGIPNLDVLEVRGAKTTAWYELSGDLALFPSALQPEPAIALPEEKSA